MRLYGRSEKQDSLVQTVRVFSKDIGMKFGIEKCRTLLINNGKILNVRGIELPDGKVNKVLQEDKSHKYLRILEADNFLAKELKVKV